MRGTIVPFPSRGPAREARQRGRKHPAPARHLVEVVRFHLAAGDRKHAFHEVGARNDGGNGALDLADVGLTAAKFGREPFLRPSLLLTPRRQFQLAPSRIGTRSYWDSLYFVNGHKHDGGAEYKQLAYVFTMHPGNRIRELRKAVGLSQSELAQRTGVSQPYISQVENQAGTTLDIARMRAIAREFDCTPADLLSDTDNPDRLTPVERELLAQFRAADVAQQQMIRRVAEPLLRYDAGPSQRDAA